MKKLKNLSSAKSAKRILGDNFVPLDEALKWFPQSNDGLGNHGEIPYSPELLYKCSDEKNPFILIPCFDEVRGIPLTIGELRIYFSGDDRFRFKFDEVDRHMPDFVFESTCKARWYLIAKNTLEIPDVRKFCDLHEFVYDNFEADEAVVYVYAYLLFYLTRGERLFKGNVRCTDTFSPVFKTMTYLGFKADKIHVGQWTPGADKIKPEPGIAASVDMYST